MSSHLLELGYFGKVHTHGDFVSEGLPKIFIEPWDRWLYESVLTSRQQLGDQWLNYYLTSPLYRFVLAPGICGNYSWLGVLMPSVDKFGRYYPMTLGLKCSHTINPFLALQTYDSWFKRIEQFMLSCLEDDFDLEQFNQKLSYYRWEKLADINEFAAEHSSTSQTENKFFPSWRHPVDSMQSISDLMPYLLDNSLKEYYFAYSLWWTPGSHIVGPSMMICKGLPHFEGMAAMLDGNWQKWGWEGKRFPTFRLKFNG